MHAESASTGSSKEGRTTLVRTLVVGLAAVLQIGVAVPFTVGLGLLAPLWGIVVGWVLWSASAAALVWTARRAPLMSPIVPLVNAGLLWLLVTVGDGWVGWTA